MKKWRKSIFGAIAFASFFLVLGSVGAMERYNISMEQGITQLLIFLTSFVACAGLAGTGKMRRGEERPAWRGAARRGQDW